MPILTLMAQSSDEERLVEFAIEVVDLLHAHKITRFQRHLMGDEVIEMDPPRRTDLDVFIDDDGKVKFGNKKEKPGG